MEDILIKALYVVALICATLVGFWIKHVSRSIGLLFEKHDQNRADIDKIKTVLVADPSKTQIFKALNG